MNAVELLEFVKAQGFEATIKVNMGGGIRLKVYGEDGSVAFNGDTADGVKTAFEGWMNEK